MPRNIDKIPRPGTKRSAAVMTARANPGLTPQEIVRKIAATPQFGGNKRSGQKRVSALP